jgi:hypothetical protein
MKPSAAELFNMDKEEIYCLWNNQHMESHEMTENILLKNSQ